MKTIMMIAALVVGTASVAQNEKVETTKVKTTVTDNMGKEVSVKETTKTTTQDMALTNFDGAHDFKTVMLPREVSTDVDYYNNGTTYRFVAQPVGYAIMNTAVDTTPYARLYPTSQKGYYVYTQNQVSSFGFFNEDGDFVVERYDAEGDKLITSAFKIKVKDDKVKIKKMK